MNDIQSGTFTCKTMITCKTMGIKCSVLSKEKMKGKNTEEIVIGINRQVSVTKSYLHFAGDDVFVQFSLVFHWF